VDCERSNPEFCSARARIRGLIFRASSVHSARSPDAAQKFRPTSPSQIVTKLGGQAGACRWRDPSKPASDDCRAGVWVAWRYDFRVAHPPREAAKQAPNTRVGPCGIVATGENRLILMVNTASMRHESVAARQLYRDSIPRHCGFCYATPNRRSAELGLGGVVWGRAAPAIWRMTLSRY
jgi:hypothetical protein